MVFTTERERPALRAAQMSDGPTVASGGAATFIDFARKPRQLLASSDMPSPGSAVAPPNETVTPNRNSAARTDLLRCSLSDRIEVLRFGARTADWCGNSGPDGL
jgi:hypothetical protein